MDYKLLLLFVFTTVTVNKCKMYVHKELISTMRKKGPETDITQD